MELGVDEEIFEEGVSSETLQQSETSRPSSPFRTWLIMAVLAVLRCTPAALPQTPTTPKPRDPITLPHIPITPQSEPKKPATGLYDGIERVCGKAEIPAVGEIAARLSDLQERQKVERGFAGEITIYISLPPDRGDGSSGDHSYSTVCFSEMGQEGLPFRQLVVSRRRGPTAMDLLEQWHVYDKRAMTHRQLEFLFPEKYSDHLPGQREIAGFNFGGGWGKHETFDHCPQEDYAKLFDTSLCLEK